VLQKKRLELEVLAKESLAREREARKAAGDALRQMVENIEPK
jgi:hypothetical protein